MKDQTLTSWKANAHEWINLLNRAGIPSRQVTNAAIVNTVVKYSQGYVLDMGCGEGWLTRALSEAGLQVDGLDATKSLVLQARSLSSNRFIHMSYEEILTDNQLPESLYDCSVFNYSLYGNQSTSLLIKSLKTQLKSNGYIIIQTVHPNFLRTTGEYESRWIDDAWKGLDGHFIMPHKWYARTMEDWLSVFNTAGYKLAESIETQSDSGDLLSVIFVLEV